MHKNDHDPKHYREQLRSEFSRRRASNPAYSLRAFAKALHLNHTFLSKILNGASDLSPKRAAQVAVCLGFNETQKQEFLKMVYLQTSGLPTESIDFEEASTMVNLDAFEVVSDWYHYAICELAECNKFDPRALAIARRLNITTSQAQTALDRLVRLGLLEKKGKTFVKTNRFIATPTDQPNRALRNFHSQMIEKAKTALEGQSVRERDITGITISVDPSKLVLAKQEIRKFQRKMAELMSSDRATEVYQLNIQLFRLSQPTQQESK